MVAQKHDLVAIRLVDPREQALPAVGLLRVVDSETGAPALVDTSSARVREAFAERAERRAARADAVLSQAPRRPRHVADGPGLRRAAGGVFPPPPHAMSTGHGTPEAARRGRLAVRVGLVLLSLAASASGAHAQTARLSVLADSVSAGAPFEVAIAVTHGPGRQVRFAEVPAGSAETGPLLMLGDVEALSVRRLPPARARRRARRQRGSTAWSRSRPTRRASGRWPSAWTAPRCGRARPWSRCGRCWAGPPPWEPAPVGPAEAFPSAAPVWLALGALALALIAGAGWALARVLRRPRLAPGPAPPTPAARARLAALAGETPTTPAEVEAHVVAVRGVVRALSRRPARGAGAARDHGRAFGDARRRPARAAPSPADAVRQSLFPTDLVAFAGGPPPRPRSSPSCATTPPRPLRPSRPPRSAPRLGPAAETDRQPGCAGRRRRPPDPQPPSP